MPDPALRVHLDLVGGLAGDMFVAALLDAFPAQREPLLVLLGRPGLAAPVDVRIEQHHGASLVGLRFVVDDPAREAARHRPAPAMHTHDGQASPNAVQHDHDHYHRHGHVAHSAIVARLEAAPIPAPVRGHALAVFALLAEAEAAVHGVPVDAVEFHEVGAWDSIIDIVASAFLIDAVGAGSWTHGPIPLGGGVVRTEHGVMPVPAPATLRLLQGQVVVDDGVPGERVTPTGAAILRYLDDQFGASKIRAGTERVGASGLGFGTRTLNDRPNLVRCTAYHALARTTPAASPLVEDWVDALEFDIDDQTGEDLSVGLDALRANDDVLQVTQMPVVGKKGRLAMRVQVVARAGAAADVAQSCFVQTTTIGLRWQRLPRFLLDRRDARVPSADGQTLAVKLASRDGAFTAKAEMDELAPHAGGHAGREAARREAEAQALEAATTTAAPAAKHGR